MRFTIVTPVLNGMPWLPDCVRTVAEQRASVDVEHLIYDAGSVDGSREWLTDHPEYGFRAFLEPDSGQTDALIKGFRRASGDILGWLNADDVLVSGALSKVAEAFSQSSDAVLVSGCCALIDAHANLVGLIPTPPVETYEGLVMNSPNPAQPATFFRAETYREIGGLNPSYDLAMDVDLWLRLAKSGRVVFLRQDILAGFRVHPASKSVIDHTRAIRQDFAIRRRNGMPVRSNAGLSLVRQAYLAPWLHPLARRVARALKSAISIDR